jgi:hypothetical protein
MCNRSPLLLFHVVQDGVGFDKLQTWFYYLELLPLHIIPCWPACLPCFGPSGLRFVAGFGGVASKACVRLTKLVDLMPTVIA